MCEANKIQQNDFEDLGDAVEAITTANEFEADIFVSKLKAHGIPSFLSYPGESGAAKLYCGRSNLAIRVMVPETKLEDARDILDPNAEYDFSEVENLPAPEDTEAMTLWARLALYCAGFILIFFFLFLVSLFV